ncbi:MAG: DUF6789 family protein [Nitrososphaeraceae archaeon]
MKNNQQLSTSGTTLTYFTENKIIRLIIIGIVATIAFDLVAYIDVTITGLPLNIPATLGEVILDKNQYSYLFGYLIHIGNGIVLSLLFGILILPVFKKILNIPTVIYAVIFSVLVTIIGVWLVMLPLLGAGIGGINMAFEVPIITMLRHISFGIVLGILVSRFIK